MTFTGNEPESGNSDRVREQASDWIARRDLGLTAADQDAFFEWLAADPKHAEVYAELQAVFKQMDIMVEWRPMHAIEPNPDLLAERPTQGRRPWRLNVLAGMAALVVLGLLGWGRWWLPGGAGPALLAVGEGARSYERHVLEDGSTVELNRGGQVSLRFEPKQRLLDLIAGEAHFKVAKDPRRPFVVRVDGVAVTAVGTEFNIARRGSEVEVIVTEGRIRLETPSARSESAHGVEHLPPLMLDAGQGVVVPVDASPGTLAVAHYAPAVMEQKLAWKNELVDFAAVPLSEVILEFNRRNHTQVVIGDEQLRDRLITGTLRPANLEGFLELLTVTQRIRVERFGNSKVVLRAEP